MARINVTYDLWLHLRLSVLNTAMRKVDFDFEKVLNISNPSFTFRILFECEDFKLNSTNFIKGEICGSTITDVRKKQKGLRILDTWDG